MSAQQFISAEIFIVLNIAMLLYPDRAKSYIFWRFDVLATTKMYVVVYILCYELLDMLYHLNSTHPTRASIILRMCARQ